MNEPDEIPDELFCRPEDEYTLKFYTDPANTRTGDGNRIEVIDTKQGQFVLVWTNAYYDVPAMLTSDQAARLFEWGKLRKGWKDDLWQPLNDQGSVFQVARLLGPVTKYASDLMRNVIAYPLVVRQKDYIPKPLYMTNFTTFGQR